MKAPKDRTAAARKRVQRMREAVNGKAKVEGPPQERYQHNTLAVKPADDAGVYAVHVLDDRQIDKLYQRGQLTVRQRDAGLRLYRDHFSAKIQKSVTGGYDGSGGGGRARKYGARPTEPVPASKAFAAYQIALKSIPKNLRPVARMVCIEDAPASRQAGFSQNRGLDLLQQALDKLADHYGFERDLIGA